MPPKESDSLLPTTTKEQGKSQKSHLFLSRKSSSIGGDNNDHSQTRFAPSVAAAGYSWWLRCCGRSRFCAIGFLSAIIAVAALLVWAVWNQSSSTTQATQQHHQERTGPYQLTQRQVGAQFFDFYSFYEGKDSLGSAGYNTYTAKQRAQDLGLIHVTNNEQDETSFVYLSSLPTDEGPRESIRLEGNQRFNNTGGLFILDLDHMPAGCGQWPAFWLTDEDHWPDHGEIDIVEGVNYQSQAKTALHTSDQCSMFAHVPDYAFSGHWDRATGLPDTFTGIMDWETNVPADNVGCS